MVRRAACVVTPADISAAPSGGTGPAGDFVAAPVRRRRRDGAVRREAVLDAGLAVFSTRGLHGASLDRIAERAGLSKANLLYYFSSKEALYVAVLRRVLDVWLDPLQALDARREPAEALGAYIRAKVTLSRDAPQASRLFCLEIVRGAPLLRAELEGDVRALVDAKAAVLSGWIAQGRIAPHDPHHLIFSIWAITQHYADFAVQVNAITGRDLSDADFFERTVASTQRLILASLGLP
ncbi:HTH-type transcriptional regulator RutR [Methylobacterium sp. J-090]|uniref:HTH-type transcriptional regulator RutR n=1 Tax=Methylobacterium sp. J-090 TaxID=2836666 RepID=UPI001FBB26F7|nr:HTH-type transcriptional regulator RutR [Methylobacterium sp. J-090]MCJ2082640.1 HTH-type transcriptional regulator RutR [Methylobacterium sp. J-090]